MQATAQQANFQYSSLGLSLRRAGKSTRPGDVTTSMVALDLLDTAPTLDVLVNLFNLAHKQVGTTVRVPWVNDANQTSFSISVCFPSTGGYPVWKLKRGFGTQAADIFIHNCGDVELIYNLISANFY
jgi:hypothetical protein